MDRSIGCLQGCKSAASLAVRRVEPVRAIQDVAIAAAAAVPCTNEVSMPSTWWHSGKTEPEAPSSWRAPAFVSKHVAAES